MESVIDLKQVTRQAGAGEVASFEALYRHLVDRIFAYIVCRIATRELAEEVTQDSFIELYRALPKFSYQSDAAFYGFVFTIVKRQLAQQYAKQARIKTEQLEETHYGETPQTERTLAVTQALATLDDRTRDIVVLHHWSRFTFGEIADMLAMHESAVRVRHHRAMGALRNVLIM